MKNWIFKSVTFVLIQMATFSANSEPIKEEVYTPIFSLTELTEENVNLFFQGKAPFILECQEGSLLPFQFAIKSEFIALKEENISNTLEITKTCFIKCIENQKLFFSKDLQIWKEFQEFFTGSISTSFHVKEEMIRASLSIELYEKS